MWLPELLDWFTANMLVELSKLLLGSNNWLSELLLRANMLVELPELRLGANMLLKVGPLGPNPLGANMLVELPELLLGANMLVVVELTEPPSPGGPPLFFFKIENVKFTEDTNNFTFFGLNTKILTMRREKEQNKI